MPLPPDVCTFLLLPGQMIPYADVVAVLAVLGALARIVIASLPISIHAASVLGAGVAGFEIHKHKLLALGLLYVLISFGITLGHLPVCTAAAG